MTAGHRYGFSLVELIVALTVLSVAVLGLAAAGTTAQRAFSAADAEDRAVRAAAAVLDSLGREAAPAAGSRELFGTVVSWEAATTPHRLELTATVELRHGDRIAFLPYRTSRARAGD
jgi:prepilin-type N-terminal cleavage/methylation domain-containing protein